jgi:hypothetical protein
MRSPAGKRPVGEDRRAGEPIAVPPAAEAPVAEPAASEPAAPDTLPSRRRVRGRTWLVVCAALFATVAIGGLTAMVVLGSVLNEYGYRPNADAATWAIHSITFAPRAECLRCHSDIRLVAASGGHANLSCQGCHGPGAAHDAATDPSTVKLAVPASDACVRCHVATAGRPGFVPLIVPSKHYTDACLDCHDPHSGIALRPPVVSHPLTDLPACITCHGPDGFRARDARHPTEATADAVCLSCHRPGRGQVESRGSP